MGGVDLKCVRAEIIFETVGMNKVDQGVEGEREEEEGCMTFSLREERKTGERKEPSRTS